MIKANFGPYSSQKAGGLRGRFAPVIGDSNEVFLVDHSSNLSSEFK
jgi:hypothetical protein